MHRLQTMCVDKEYCGVIINDYDKVFDKSLFLQLDSVTRVVFLMIVKMY